MGLAGGFEFEFEFEFWLIRWQLWYSRAKDRANEKVFYPGPLQRIYLNVSTDSMSQQALLPSLSEADIENKTLLRDVRRQLDDNRQQEEVNPSLLEHWPQSVAPDPIARPKLLICRSEGLQVQKDMLWAELYSIAAQSFMFVRITGIPQHSLLTIRYTPNLHEIPL